MPVLPPAAHDFFDRVHFVMAKITFLLSVPMSSERNRRCSCICGGASSIGVAVWNVPLVCSAVVTDSSEFRDHSQTDRSDFHEKSLWTWLSARSKFNQMIRKEQLMNIPLSQTLRNRSLLKADEWMFGTLFEQGHRMVLAIQKPPPPSRLPLHWPGFATSMPKKYESLKGHAELLRNTSTSTSLSCAISWLSVLIIQDVRRARDRQNKLCQVRGRNRIR